MDVHGRSGGLASGWNLKSCPCDDMWIFYFGIGLELYDAHLRKV